MNYKELLGKYAEYIPYGYKLIKPLAFHLKNRNLKISEINLGKRNKYITKLPNFCSITLYTETGCYMATASEIEINAWEKSTLRFMGSGGGKVCEIFLGNIIHTQSIITENNDNKYPFIKK